MHDQDQRERQMASLGRSRSRSIIAKALKSGEAGMTPAGVALAKRAIEPLSKAIIHFLATANAGKGGRIHVAAALLEGVDVDLTAFVAVRSCLNAAPRRYTLKSTALSLAERLETELIADAFEEENSALYRAVIRNARSRGLAPERQAKSMLMANKQFGIVEKKWTPRERILVGTKLVELVIESLGIIESALISNGKTRTHRLQLAETTQEWFAKYNDAATLTRPMYLPTVVPPMPWQDPTAGPYYTPIMGSMSILSRGFPGQLDALRKADMATVYAGLNGLQETPWRINTRVLDVIQEAWERDAGLTCLPSREDEPIPPAPQDVQDDEVGGTIRKAWRQKVRAIYEGNAAARSGRFELARALSIAEENRDQPQIFFPHRLDFRGRAYAAATSLNPQGSDDVRSMIEFAEGKPLGERGAFWLGVHGANLFGNDKVSLDDRERWAHENWLRAAEVARDPLGNLWWTEADKPWCFLAWCFEWADAMLGDNTSFVSHLPIALDGSCNGIQHFSAMLRDPVGGAAVNLVPSPTPQDIYQRVADRVKERLEEHAEEGLEAAWIAQGWLSFGIDRKTTKRAVMVLPYGGTYKSCLDYVRESVKDRFSNSSQIDPFGADRVKAEAILASLVWASIADIVVAAKEAMSWLQQIARVATKAGQPLHWTTPSGFVVHQQYRELKDKRIETRFCGSVVKFTTLEEKETLDKNRQCSAVSPNFVHSLDASAMMLTIKACREVGIRSFAMIHDSYGTHAADTDTLAHILRREFVRMYLDHDVLANFRETVAATLTPEQARDLPPVPTPGTLDLLAVLESPYFFA